MKRYFKPKFSIIRFHTESLLAAQSPDGSIGDGTTPGFGTKAQTFRIIDDTDDWE